MSSSSPISNRSIARHHLFHLINSINTSNYTATASELSNLVDSYNLRPLFHHILLFYHFTDSAHSNPLIPRILSSEAKYFLSFSDHKAPVESFASSIEKTFQNRSTFQFEPIDLFEFCQQIDLDLRERFILAVSLCSSSSRDLQSQASALVESDTASFIRDINQSSFVPTALLIDYLYHHLYSSNVIPKPYQSSFEQTLDRLLCPDSKNMATKIESIADLVRDIGYNVFSNATVFHKILAQAGVSSSNSSSLKEEMLSRLIGMMVKTHSSLPDGISNGKVGQPWAQIVESNKTAPKNSWDIDVFISVVMEIVPNTNWVNVMKNLDYSTFEVTDLRGFELLVNAYRKGSKSKKFPIQILFGRWKNPKAQYSLLNQAISSPPDTFNFADYTIAETRKIVNPDELAGVITGSVKSPINTTPNQALNSLDVLDTICKLLESSECYDECRQFLETAALGAPELTLLGLVQLPLPWTSLQKSIISRLTILFLEGHANSNFVLSRLWTFNSNVLVSCMVEMHQDPGSLSRILDVAQELKALGTVLKSTPFPFALDLASLASRREFLNLEKWLQDMIRDHGEIFIKACLEFMGIKLMAQSHNAAPVVPLAIEVIAIFLKTLQAHTNTVSPDTAELLKEVSDRCLQVYPRLMNVWPTAGVAHDMPNSSEVQFSEDVEHEVNLYYEKLYKGDLMVKDIIELLARFKVSNETRQQDVYACMIHNLFDEYKFFPKYPDKELAITAALFGALIQHDLLSYVPLGLALRYILDALRQSPTSKMFKFGLRALSQFVSRLAEWPQYCNHLLQVPALLQAAPEIIDILQQKLLLASKQETSSDDVSFENPPELPTSVFVFKAITPDPSLITPESGSIEYESPAESVQDKLLFIINNLSQSNMVAKLKEMKPLLQETYYRWFSNYLVTKRASIEPNFQTLYLDMLDSLESKSLDKHVLYETLFNIKILLDSEKTIESSQERSHLKNLGSWLGGMTLARNKPIKHKHLSVKDLLLEGYDSQRLVVVIPFVCKVLEQCKLSKIFKPPNPWVMSSIKLLVELYQFAELKLNLKFEIEVLCKNINVELSTIEPTNILKNRPSKEEPEAALTGELDRLNLKDGPRKLGGVAQGDQVTPQGLPLNQAMPTQDLSGVTFANLASYIVFSPQVTIFTQQPALKRLVHIAISRAIQEIIGPVVERSVTIAAISTRELIVKDFALESDETKMRKAAHLMAQNLAGSLALVTCKEPLKISMVTHLRTLLLQNGLSEQNLPEQQILQVIADNLDLACSIIEKAAMEKAIPEVEEGLVAPLMNRKKARERGTPYYDVSVFNSSRYASALPEFLRLKPSGLAPPQLRVYEDFSRTRQYPGVVDGEPARPPAVAQSHADVASQLAFNATPTAAATVPQFEENQSLLTAQQAFEKFTQFIADLDKLVSSSPTVSLVSLPANHEVRYLLREIPQLLSQSMNRDDLALLFAQKVVQCLYKNDSHLSREVYVVLLRDLCELSKKAAKEVLAWLLYADDERKYNVDVAYAILRAGLLSAAEQDIQLGKMMESGRTSVIDYTVKLIRKCVLEEPPLATASEFLNSIDILGRIAQRVNAPGSVNELLEDLRKKNAVPAPEPKDVESALRDQLSFAFAEWIRIYQLPTSTEKVQTAFLQQLQQSGLIKSEDAMCLFFRVATELSTDSYLKLKNAPGATHLTVYQPIDALAKLIVLLTKLFNETPTARLTYFNKIVSIIVLVLVHNHEVKKSQFNQKPFFRLFSSLLSELNANEHLFRSIHFQMLTALSNTFHTLQPYLVPGFTFGWLSLVSHRQFMPKLLLADNQKGWPLFQRLLLDLFKFLIPFLRKAELKDASRLLYKGTLRLLLVLLHDFPEFLCDYHFSFCDVIPSSCVQLRNLILSAFPRNMRLPDPFTPNLKVDMLPEIAHPPKVLSDYVAALSANNFKNDLDNYLKNRSPVSFLFDLRQRLLLSEGQSDDVTGSKYDVPLINSLVLYLGTQAVSQLQNKVNQGSSPIAHSIYMDIFQQLLVDLDTEGRYLFLSAIVNQLRYPNSHTHYFSCVLLYLFAEARKAAIQEQITRVLLERLIVNRPHPWGLLITFIELIKNPRYKFWEHGFTRCASDIERLFESVARSINQS